MLPDYTQFRHCGNVFITKNNTQKNQQLEIAKPDKTLLTTRPKQIKFNSFIT